MGDLEGGCGFGSMGGPVLKALVGLEFDTQPNTAQSSGALALLDLQIMTNV